MRLVNIDDCNRSLFYKQSGGKDSLITVESVFNMFEALPTAYDIGKVVAELEEMKMRYFLTIANTGDEKSDFAYENVGNALDKAIEIVKQGDVSDDVCEYENTDDEYCKWKINSVFLETINNPHVAERENIETAKYCPCCGKKIKVVE